MADLQWSDLTIVIDTREQLPLDFGELRTESGTLDLGDYSVLGLEHVIRIERKSLGDLVACCGRERERFSREVERLRAYDCRAVVCETSWPELELGEWRSKLTSRQVIGSVAGWIASGVPFVMAGDRTRAARLIARIAFITARRRVRENQALTQGTAE